MKSNVAASKIPTKQLCIRLPLDVIDWLEVQGGPHRRVTAVVNELIRTLYYQYKCGAPNPKKRTPKT